MTGDSTAGARSASLGLVHPAQTQGHDQPGRRRSHPSTHSRHVATPTDGASIARTSATGLPPTGDNGNDTNSTPDHRFQAPAHGNPSCSKQQRGIGTSATIDITGGHSWPATEGYDQVVVQLERLAPSAPEIRYRVTVKKASPVSRSVPSGVSKLMVSATR